jgi:hypothetical protein
LNNFEKLVWEVETPLYCKNCGRNICSYDAFCEFCGKPNPRFSVIEFENFWNEPFAQEIVRCQNGHQGDQEVFLEDPGLYEDVNFCSVCGQRLIFKVIPIEVFNTN